MVDSIIYTKDFEYFPATQWPQIRHTFPAPECLMDKLLPARAKTLLHGSPGSGKSALLWGIGNAVVSGEDYLGFQCTQAKVLLISFDMNKHELNQRWSDTFVPLFDIIVAHAVDCAKPGFRLTPLYKQVQQIDAELVLIDALGGLHSGRSAKDDETADGVDRELSVWLPNSTIVVIGHDRKTRYGEGGRPIPPTDEDFLGSQKWRANFTNQLHLWKTREHQSRLVHSKSQVIIRYDTPIDLYMDLQGQAELWDEARAKEVIQKFRSAVIKLNGQNLPISKQVELVAKHYGVSDRHAWRWYSLSKMVEGESEKSTDITD